MPSFARVELRRELLRLAGPSTPSASLIEIVLPRGPTVRVDARVDEHALHRVLGVLRG